MKRILLMGAGRSSPYLVSYLLDACREEGWELRLADLNPEPARELLAGHAHAEALAFDVLDELQRDAEVSQADLVISLLPVGFHPHVARACLRWRKPMVTASYVSPEIQALDEDAREAGLLFLMECGLDPGIDHMSAMQVLDGLRAAGHEITAFETFTGGLLAPASCLDNPWEYKFTWNPRNVVLAGASPCKFIQEGTYKYIPYHRLFRRTEIIHIPGHGFFEGYANRDSLRYLQLYGLEGIRTLYRGTLRRPGFCRTWDTFVQLGCTDDSYLMEGVEQMTHRQFINSFLYYDPRNSVELKLAYYMGIEIDGQEMYRLRWLGIFDEEPVGLSQGTPAQILEHILKKRWSLAPEDRDMIVMWHKFDYLDQGVPRQKQSHMVLEGADTLRTAMAKTVGLPVGIAARRILQGVIRATGVQIPVRADIYQPILEGLRPFGIEFHERQTDPR